MFGEIAEFPDEDAIQSAIGALETLEAAVRVAVSSHAQRQVLEALFVLSRVLRQHQGREPRDGKTVFESLPLSEEFVLLKLPAAAKDSGTAGAKRMYAEIRERHLRLAISCGF